MDEESTGRVMTVLGWTDRGNHANDRAALIPIDAIVDTTNHFFLIPMGPPLDGIG